MKVTIWTKNSGVILQTLEYMQPFTDIQARVEVNDELNQFEVTYGHDLYEQAWRVWISAAILCAWIDGGGIEK